MALLSQLSALAGSVAEVLALRTWPLLVFALVSPRFGTTTKLLAFATYASIAGLALSADPRFLANACGFAIGFAYLALCALAIVVAAHRGYLRRLPRPALIALLTAAFVVVPGSQTELPGGFIVLMTGWELFFSGYSYVLESARPTHVRSLPTALFFLLVNPALSYPERGRWLDEAHPDAQALRRCATGAALLFAQALSAPLGPLIVQLTDAIETPWAASYTRFVLGCAIGLGRAFLAQAGVAHVHIGSRCRDEALRLRASPDPYRAQKPS